MVSEVVTEDDTVKEGVCDALNDPVAVSDGVIDSVAVTDGVMEPERVAAAVNDAEVDWLLVVDADTVIEEVREAEAVRVAVLLGEIPSDWDALGVCV